MVRLSMFRSMPCCSAQRTPDRHGGEPEPTVELEVQVELNGPVIDLMALQVQG